MDQQDIPVPDFSQATSSAAPVENSAGEVPFPPTPPATLKPESTSFTPPPAATTFSQPPKRKPVFLIIMAILAFLLVGVYLIITLLPSFGLSSQISSLKERIFSNKKTVVLNYWGLFEPPAVFQEVITDYEKSHPGIKIEYVQEDLKEYRERLQSALERQEGPDIFRIHQTWVPMLGSFLSPIPQNVYNNSAFEQTFYASAKQTLKYNGQYVAIPLMIDGLALFYNEDIFRANGQSPPTTWDELKHAACQLTVRDEQGKIRVAGVALGTTNNVDHWSDILGLMMLQNSADLANPAACIKDPNKGEATCLGKDALTFYTLFVTDRVCADENTNVGPVWSSLLPTSTYAFATGKVAMYFGPSWRAFDIKNINGKLNFRIVNVPQLPGGEVNWSSYWAEAVSKNSKHQTEAWEFLQYLSSSKVLQKLYQTESNLRLFGEPYPRVDMAEQAKSQPFVWPFVQQAVSAKSWYLSSNTFDNGLNDQIIKYYEDAVNAVNTGNDPLRALTTTTQGVAQVLNKYGLTR